MLGKLKAAGFDGVELPIFAGTPADYKPIRAELDKQGLKCTAVTILTKETNAISPDAATRQKASDWLKNVIEINHVLGCGDGVRAVPLGHRRVLRQPARPQTRRSARPTCSRQAAELAKQANLMMAIEYLNRFECYFLNTAAAAVELVKAVNHPNFRTMYDTFHAHIEEKDPAAAIRTVAPVLAHVHISENDRGTPGTGQVNWDETFKTLERDQVRRLADDRGVRPGAARPGGRDAKSGATCSRAPRRSTRRASHSSKAGGSDKTGPADWIDCAAPASG